MFLPYCIYRRFIRALNPRKLVNKKTGHSRYCGFSSQLGFIRQRALIITADRPLKPIGIHMLSGILSLFSFPLGLKSPHKRSMYGTNKHAFALVLTSYTSRFMRIVYTVILCPNTVVVYGAIVSNTYYYVMQCVLKPQVLHQTFHRLHRCMYWPINWKCFYMVFHSQATKPGPKAVAKLSFLYNQCYVSAGYHVALRASTICGLPSAHQMAMQGIFCLWSSPAVL